MFHVNRGGEDQLRSYLRGIAPSFAPEQWPERSEEVRAAVRSKIFLKGLPADVLDGAPDVEWREVLERPDYLIRKLRFRVIDRYWVPALLYEPVGSQPGSRVAVLNAGGHHDSGKAAPYSQIRSINLAKRGVLALTFEFPGMGEMAADAEARLDSGASLHHGLAALELVGMGAASLMFVAMTRALDVLVSHPDTDPGRVAMTGLSGGGWQTIVLSALDTRIKLVVPVAGYTSSRSKIEETSDVGDVEQVPADLASLVDYPDLTAMLAPRPTLLILNEFDDCCFRTARTRSEVYDQVIPVFRSLDAEDNFELYSNRNPGTHNYDAESRSRFYGFLAKHCGESWPTTDIHLVDEVLSEHMLTVGMPQEQRSVREIASERARHLAQERSTRRADPSSNLIGELSSVLRLPQWDAELPGPLAAASWEYSFELGPWSVPASWHAGDGSVVIAIEDEVSAGSAPDHGSGARLEVSLLGLKGLPCSLERVLMLQTLGERLLGVQVAQLIAVSRATAERGSKPIRLSAHGLNSTMVAILAAALDPGLFAEVSLSGHRIARLDDLLYRGVSPVEVAALFCPDLLQVTDVFDLRGALGETVLVEAA